LFKRDPILYLFDKRRELAKPQSFIIFCNFTSGTKEQRKAPRAALSVALMQAGKVMTPLLLSFLFRQPGSLALYSFLLKDSFHSSRPLFLNLYL
jgi:hypothetical protein